MSAGSRRAECRSPEKSGARVVLLLITGICETVSALRRDIDRIMRRNGGSAQSRVLATA
jgi:hypothetical protein